MGYTYSMSNTEVDLSDLAVNSDHVVHCNHLELMISQLHIDRKLTLSCTSSLNVNIFLFYNVLYHCKLDIFEIWTWLGKMSNLSL